MPYLSDVTFAEILSGQPTRTCAKILLRSMAKLYCWKPNGFPIPTVCTANLKPASKAELLRELLGRRLLILLIAFYGTGARSEDAGEAARTSPHFGKTSSSSGPYDEICRTIERAAADNNLPVEFFTRVIWQESKFNVSARSSAGAQGIAQFMPRTASSRGLLDPFDPIEALHESANYLRELKKTFGNLGLAAAAYNAGPGRLGQWLAGKGHLPAETITYVRLVTGRSVSEWISPQPPQWEGAEIPKGVPCATFANLSNKPSPQNVSAPRTSPWAPWGIQLAGHWTQGQVLGSYEKLRRRYFTVLGVREPLVVITYGPSGRTKRYLVRVAENTREEAGQLCSKLQSVGGSCFVVRNPQ